MTSVSSTTQLLEFECRGRRLALPLESVRRAIPAAEPVPIPGAGEVVLGMLNLGGEIVTVLDLCYRLGLPRSALSPAQQILVLDVAGLACGIVVDRIDGVGERALDGAVPDELHAPPYVKGVLRLDDGLCLIVDPAHVLFPEERQALAQALAGGSDGEH